MAWTTRTGLSLGFRGWETIQASYCELIEGLVTPHGLSEHVVIHLVVVFGTSSEQ